MTVPSGFTASLPLKLFTHGFTSTVNDEDTLFVPAWMEATGQKVNVVMLDWQFLAKLDQVRAFLIFHLISRLSRPGRSQGLPYRTESWFLYDMRPHIMSQ